MKNIQLDLVVFMAIVYYLILVFLINGQLSPFTVLACTDVVLWKTNSKEIKNENIKALSYYN